MLYFLVCFVLAALPALGEPPDIAPVALYTHFDRQPAPGVAESARREVESILAPLGFPLKWQSLDGVRGNEVSTSLAVVTYRGRCASDYLVAPGRVSAPLGITHVSDGVVLPFTDIDCDAIRIFLRKELMRQRAEDRELYFGRAVGRVLAHELFHIFTGSRHHGSDGVAKPVFTERELLEDTFRFEASEFRVLRASLKQARQQNKRLRPVASPVSGQYIFRESGCTRCHGSSGQGTRSAPALRCLPADLKALMVRLSHKAPQMCSRTKSGALTAPPLDEDELADLASFLAAAFE
jgi:hypothetical protein